MKKKIVAMVSIGLVLVIAVAGIFVFGKDKIQSIFNFGGAQTSVEDSQGVFDLLLCETKSDLEAFAKKNQNEIFYDAEYGWVSNVKMFTSYADVEVLFHDSDIARISMDFSLIDIPYPEEDIPEEEWATEDIEEEYIPYDFNEAEWMEAVQYYTEVKEEFEQFLGCGSIEQYDVIKTGIADGIDLSALTEDQQFQEGYIVKEYSVRDANGILWLLRFSASDYGTRATVVKLIDQTGFDGFMPIVDMGKVSE